VLRANLGEGAPDTAQAMSNLARVYVALEKHGDAEPLFEKALQIFREKNEPESNAAVALNGLGLVRNSQRRHSEALAFFEEALTIFEREHDPKFSDCATVLRNMAAVFHGLGDSRKAAEALKRAQQVSDSC
jgi:tetratricopeptide (TPR) repeat protein